MAAGTLLFALLLSLSYSTVGYINLGAEIALVGRLWQLKLTSIYRYFTIFLVIDILRSAAYPLYFGAGNTDAYAWFYIGTTPLVALLQVSVVLELYSLVLRHYTGIRTFGKWVVSGGLAAGLVIAALTLVPDLSNLEQQYVILLYGSLFERTVASTLLVFLVVITTFLIWFPVPLSRNTVIHTLLFGLYFSMGAILLMLRNVLGPEIARTLSTWNLMLGTVCFAAWSILLRRQDEERVVVVGHRWRPGADRRLVEQLQAINNSLLRTGRK